MKLLNEELIELSSNIKELGEENVINVCLYTFWKERTAIVLKNLLGEDKGKELMEESEDQEKALISSIKNTIKKIKSSP